MEKTRTWISLVPLLGFPNSYTLTFLFHFLYSISKPLEQQTSNGKLLTSCLLYSTFFNDLQVYRHTTHTHKYTYIHTCTHIPHTQTQTHQTHTYINTHTYTTHTHTYHKHTTHILTHTIHIYTDTLYNIQLTHTTHIQTAHTPHTYTHHTYTHRHTT